MGTGPDTKEHTQDMEKQPDGLRLDPSAFFESPEEVRDSQNLSNEEKIAILRSWSYDSAELSVAVEEGMPEGAAAIDDMEQRVLIVLEELTGGPEFEDTGPSKQHGIPSGAGKS
ncbi:MAG: hypothetical protein PVF63_03250 [Gammaproteobacteria bacterium]|jgi:hypothetical protein